MIEKQKTILIIEDETSLRSALSSKLKKNNFKTYECGDGKSGLKKATTSHPDLILLDVLLPKMSGIAVLKELRSNDWGKTVPIIMLTNVDSAETFAKQKSTDKKTLQYLIKAEWSLGELVKQIELTLK